MSTDVTIFTRPNCHLCDLAIEATQRVVMSSDTRITINTVNIDSDVSLRKKYGDRIPCVFVEGDLLFEYEVDEESFRKYLRDSHSS